MIYECKKAHRTLTVGKRYVEWASNPNAYNAVVKNDSGDYEYFPRGKFFKVIENGKD